ncbi:hypothetical protein FNF31_06409 [Cafeteria roenbergensis]|uniref:CRIM domain-containing protein n=1 Tax=Cafeteria roenbergensis TaxID=33653 RepID=A0A5A8DBM0_CAFRO|nr:hypothetical protein FNF31_06409 [Cafeteria roenbergensis]KAA0162756.1 hypothetical protein FNF28_04574 [Cafeteria roenbergensis]
MALCLSDAFELDSTMAFMECGRMLVPLPDDDDFAFPGDPLAPDPLFSAARPWDGAPCAAAGAFAYRDDAAETARGALAHDAALESPTATRRPSAVHASARLDSGSLVTFEPERSRSRSKRVVSFMAKQRSPKLRMTIYLPDRSPVRVQVHESAIVLDVIGEAMRVAKQSRGVELPGDVQCYTLRMHEEGGMPDLDFPALDRLRRMLHFASSQGVGSGNEYCLEVDEGAMALWTASHDAGAGARPSGDLLVLIPVAFASDATDAVGGRKPLRRRSSASRAPPRPVTVAPSSPSATVADVLRTALARAGIHPHSDVFMLKLTEADRARLRIAERVLLPSTPVSALAAASVTVLHLARRPFADEPATAAAVPGKPGAEPIAALLAESGSKRSGGGDARARAATADSARGRLGETARGAGPAGIRGPPGGRVMRATQHSIVTASQFEQWRVVKVNNLGRRQPRVLGIDISRITNTKRPNEGRGWLSSGTTRVAERLMAEVVRVEIPAPDSSDEANRSISITFIEGMDQTTLRYVCESEEDRQQIVAKLTFILKLNGEGHKIVQL